MAAPAAPVVVEGGALAALTGALVLAVLVWASLFCMQQFYTYTLGALLHGLSSVLNAIPLISLGDRTVGKVDDFVQAAIGRALSGAETSVGRTWHALGYVARLTAYTVEVLAHETLGAIHAITRSGIPDAVRGAVVPNISRLSAAVTALTASVAGIRRDLYARVGELERDIGRGYARAHAEVGAITSGALPALRREVGELERDLGDLRGYAHRTLNHRVGRLEAIVAGTALTAAIVATVSRFAPWWRCNNVGKAGKAICRMDPFGLDNLLSGLLLIFGTVSLLDLARGMQSITEEAADAVRSFLREASAVDAGNAPNRQIFGIESGALPAGTNPGVASGRSVFGIEA